MLAVLGKVAAKVVKMIQECAFPLVKKPGVVSSSPFYCVLHQTNHLVQDSKAFSNLLIEQGERHDSWSMIPNFGETVLDEVRGYCVGFQKMR